MSQPTRILYCHCAYAEIVPKQVKNEVLRQLADSGVEFEAVADLCEMSARKDPKLKELADGSALRIAACYPRAVKWLFAAGGAPLDGHDARIMNMRTQSADEVGAGLLDGQAPPASAGRRISLQQAQERIEQQRQPWKPWFPVIDYARCTNCMQCLSFCLFDVYGVSGDGKITVRNETNCKTDCPACSRVCPEVAILFPKYRGGPINGDEVNADDVRREAMKVDISALLGGDIYSTLRDRNERAKSRFSKERDEDRALKERLRCLSKLGEEMSIPPEVLSSLPSMQEIQSRAEAAKAKAAAAVANVSQTHGA